MTPATDIIRYWPEESRHAALLVIDQYGEPDEVTDFQLTWHYVGPWKRMVVSRTFYQHDFPTPHTDAVESIIDYRVPPEDASAIAAFDGSVIVERTAGEVSVRCHDEQANFLALNLVNDIVSGVKTPEQARQYYVREFLNYRRNLPTPYMDGLRFSPGDLKAADPDRRVLSDQDVQQAFEAGKPVLPS